MSWWKRADKEAPQESLNWTPQMNKDKAEPQYYGQKVWHRFEDKEDLYIGNNWTQIEDNEIMGQVMREVEHVR